MRINDNPALTSNTLASDDVMLLTDVSDKTPSNIAKDKKLTFQNLASWVIQKASISFNAYTVGSRTLEDLVSTKPIDQDTINLNDYTVPGRYAMVAGDNRTYTNYPNNAVNGWLDVYKYAGTIRQYFHRLGSAPTTFKDEYFRMYIPGTATWTDWEKIITATSLNSALSNYVPTSRTVNGHALSGNITVTASDLGLADSVIYNAIAAKPVDSGTNTNLGNTGSLAAGAYIIIGEAYIGASDNATGRRSLWFSVTSGGASAVNEAQNTVPGTQGGKMQVILVVSHTKATTYHLNYYQNSTESKNVSGSITILKIHG